MKIRIFPLGDAALTVEFGNEISVELNDRAVRLAQFFESNPFPGFVETVPAYASLSVFYTVPVVRKNFPEFPTAFDAVKSLAEKAWQKAGKSAETEPRLVEIPVCFGAEYAPDLDSLAAENKLTEKKFVEIYVSKIYRVYMLGFLPGFAYMGEVDRRVAAPRKDSPRLKVPKGSVGIAGRQTGIYSLESPGGWQIIGKTNVELFTPEAAAPTFLRAGDEVKFYAAKF